MTDSKPAAIRASATATAFPSRVFCEHEGSSQHERLSKPAEISAPGRIPIRLAITSIYAYSTLIDRLDIQHDRKMVSYSLKEINQAYIYISAGPLRTILDAYRNSDLPNRWVSTFSTRERKCSTTNLIGTHLHRLWPDKMRVGKLDVR